MANIVLNVTPEGPYWVELEYLSCRGDWRPMPSFREWARNGVCRKFICAADFRSEFSYRWRVYSPCNFEALATSTAFEFPKAHNETIISHISIQPCVAYV